MEATSIETPWGVVTEYADDRARFLGDRPVVEMDEFYIVLGMSNGKFCARWIDESGEKHEKVFARSASAVKHARSKWGA